MALGANTPWLARLVALVVACTLALVAAGAAADGAQAGSPCTKYGDQRADELRDRQARAAIRCLLNRKRHQHGMSRLDNDKKLQRASQKHTEMMMKKACFSHQCPGEGSLEARLRSVAYLLSGLLRWTYGENIAYGGDHYGTPKTIMNAWMNSSGHRANILNPAFRDVGVGVEPGIPGNPHSKGGTYTTDFGMRLLG
jgi:uncharacterized protein YkwD